MHVQAGAQLADAVIAVLEHYAEADDVDDGHLCLERLLGGERIDKALAVEDGLGLFPVETGLPGDFQGHLADMKVAHEQIVLADEPDLFPATLVRLVFEAHGVAAALHVVRGIQGYFFDFGVRVECWHRRGLGLV